LPRRTGAATLDEAFLRPIGEQARVSA